MKRKAVTVALSKDFLTKAKDLPREASARAITFGLAWRKNPTSPKYNYETIKDAPDNNLRSLRFDDDFRAIVLRSERGDAYVMLWIDGHEQAWEWARTHRCEVHPDTGSLQIFQVDEASEKQEEHANDIRIGGLFDEYTGEQLRALGVPPQLMFRVRHIMTRPQFEEVGLLLPSDAYESLLFLLEGESYHAVHDLVTGSSIPVEKEIDTTDIATALEDDTSKQEFTVVEDEEELEQMLTGSLEAWRIFLHRSQRRLVDKTWRGPVRVLGGAGTGKTVVAMHRAKYLAESVFTDPDHRILFTTFTRNLAEDIKNNLRKLCDTKAMKRIEVVSLDRWVNDFLKRQGFEKQIKYFGNSRDTRLQELWEQALLQKPLDQSLPDSFYREEWEQVIQGKGVSSLREYARADRTGRGSALHRGPRKAIWPVFEEYRNLMATHGVCEREDAIRAARQILEEKGDILPYRSVLVDEAQDMSNEAFKLIREIVPTDERGRENDIFIVGDGHQRIYNHSVVLSHCRIHIVGRSHRLRINYRTSEEIRRFAVSVLEGFEIDDLDGGEDTQRGYTSLVKGIAPTIKPCTSLADEIDAIVKFLGAPDKQRETCIVTRTNALLDTYKQHLEARGITTYLLSRSAAEDPSKAGVRMATMHRVKGLEFDRVVLAGIDEGKVPLAAAIESTEDGATREALEIQERALFYVACTRAKREVLVTCSHTLSPFIAEE